MGAEIEIRQPPPHPVKQADGQCGKEQYPRRTREGRREAKGSGASNRSCS
jgi:hypothetical protein